jgi:carbamate kinase
MPAGRALDVGTAELQGTLGYAIQQALGNLCRGRGLDVPVAAVVTRVLVDPRDPAFARPTTPIGPAYPPARVKRLARATGWTIGRDGRRGFRRLVASPRPVRVLDAEVVRRLSLAGAVTIACGGGGVPVVETPDGFRGVEAVIEPELGAAALATGVGAGRLVMLTAVEHAAVSYGTAREIAIERLTLTEGRTLLAAGEFPPRSMGPKVEAGLRFVEAGGGEAIITSLARVSAALAGEAGTRIVAAD